jgi:hypothetical protein
MRTKFARLKESKPRAWPTKSDLTLFWQDLLWDCNRLSVIASRLIEPRGAIIDAAERNCRFCGGPRYADFEKEDLWVDACVRRCNFSTISRIIRRTFPSLTRNLNLSQKPREIPSVLQQRTAHLLIDTHVSISTAECGINTSKRASSYEPGKSSLGCLVRRLRRKSLVDS